MFWNFFRHLAYSHMDENKCFPIVFYLNFVICSSQARIKPPIRFIRDSVSLQVLLKV
jgi:hypothetical protein